MSDNGSGVYDLDTLKRGLESIRANIRAIEQALSAEREKEAEYLGHISSARGLLTLHGVNDDGVPE